MEKFKEMKELECDDLEHKKFPHKEYAEKLHNNFHEQVHHNLKRGIKIWSAIKKNYWRE